MTPVPFRKLVHGWNRIQEPTFPSLIGLKYPSTCKMLPNYDKGRHADPAGPPVSQTATAQAHIDAVWFLVGNGGMGYGDYYWGLFRDYYFPTKHQGFEGPGRFQMKACGVQMLPHFFNAVSDI